jgi:hypothetical protein
MTALASIHLQRSALAMSTSGCRSGMTFVVKLWRKLLRDFLSPYQPELHYMRGPGPRWREKHGAVSTRDGGIPAVGQPTEMNQRAAAQCHEVHAIATRMCRETKRLPAIEFQGSRSQEREIVEARRMLIAELEQRRRVPWGWGHELREAA